MSVRAPSKNNRVAPALLLAAIGSLTGCLAVGPQGPSLLTPVAHEQLSTAEQAAALRTQMAARIAPLLRYTGDFRLSAVGPEGRIRVLGQLLLERPDHARVTLLLPFGAPAWLGVCNGESLAAWDVPRARIRRAPATRAGLAELSALGDVGLTPAEAIALGWGEVVPPAYATLQHIPGAAAQPEAWLWRWQDEAGFLRALKVAHDGTAEELEIKTPAGDRAVITFYARGALKLPTGLRLRLRLTPHDVTGRNDEAHVTVAEVKFSDLSEVPPPTPNAFVLTDRPLP